MIRKSVALLFVCVLSRMLHSDVYSLMKNGGVLCGIPVSPGSIAGPKLPVWDSRIFTKNQFQMMTKKRKKIRPITLIWPEFYPIWTFWLMLSYLLVSRTLEWILNGVSSRYVFTFFFVRFFSVSFVSVRFLIWFSVHDERRRNAGNMFGEML